MGRSYTLNMDDVLEDHYSGMTYTAIAEKHGCSPQVISRRLKEVEPQSYISTRPPTVSHRASCEPDDPWQSLGRCNDFDPEVWFDKMAEADAKYVCRTMCVVRAQCLEAALASREPWGVLGGLSERERNEILRRREKAARAAA